MVPPFTTMTPSCLLGLTICLPCSGLALWNKHRKRMHKCEVLTKAVLALWALDSWDVLRLSGLVWECSSFSGVKIKRFITNPLNLLFTDAEKLLIGRESTLFTSGWWLLWEVHGRSSRVERARERNGGKKTQLNPQGPQLSLRQNENFTNHSDLICVLNIISSSNFTGICLQLWKSYQCSVSFVPMLVNGYFIKM